MDAKWGTCVIFAGLLALSTGCRQTQPVLKPDPTPEVARIAPMEARYESSAYPKQAFDNANQDPSKRYSIDSKNIVPTKGSMAPGAGGMGGMGGR